MKNPLIKRLPREFVDDIAKYMVIFLFMAATIGFISGFLVAGGSMIQAYNESFGKYNVENGHFVLMDEASDELLAALEEEQVSVYPDYYIEEEEDRNKDGEADSTIRIFFDRDKNNQVCLMEGELPEKEDEIAIDRMYADNNKFTVGDTIHIDGKDLTISGLVALSDYSALFSDTTDMMFDAVKFGVAVVTEEGFGRFPKENLHYSYCWYYDEEPEDEIAEKEVSDELLEVISGHGIVTTFIPRYANSAINFTGNDMGGDRSMMLILLYILIIILAFVFAVTMNHTITRESATIGTLRALGYTRKELLWHYMTLPMLVTFAAAVVGNVLGYTVFKNIVVQMYYHSYSLPSYVTIWNAQAFWLTTAVPLVLMFLINLFSLIRALRHTPLAFIRRDIGKKGQKRLVRLPEIGFFHRFRLRVILQNIPNFVILFIGILFADLLLLFGLMMTPLLDHYQNLVVDNMIADYQYVLKAPAETDTVDVEKYSVTTLKILMDGYNEEEIMAYGIMDDSDYVRTKMPVDGVVISNGFAEKFKLKEGDEVTLREAYGKKEYTFQIKDIMDYPATLSVFMSQKNYAETFGLEEEYFNGYFSNEKIKDIGEEMFLSCITEDDLTKTSRQLDLSMGKMFYLLEGFAVLIFLLLIYLLTKLIIEKNTHSISMVKILGYMDNEIAGLYLMATSWVVIVSMVLGIVFSTWMIQLLYFYIMKDYSGWLTVYLDPKVFVQMFFMGIGCYVLVAATQFFKIHKIPMDEALKNVE